MTRLHLDIPSFEFLIPGRDIADCNEAEPLYRVAGEIGGILAARFDIPDVTTRITPTQPRSWDIPLDLAIDGFCDISVPDETSYQAVVVKTKMPRDIHADLAATVSYAEIAHMPRKGHASRIRTIHANKLRTTISVSLSRLIVHPSDQALARRLGSSKTAKLWTR